jgi:hypothetical protein
MKIKIATEATIEEMNISFTQIPAGERDRVNGEGDVYKCIQVMQVDIQFSTMMTVEQQEQLRKRFYQFYLNGFKVEGV